MIILIERENGRTRTYCQFQDCDKYLAIYLRTALELDRMRPIDCVILKGDSVESIKKDYPKYFTEQTKEKEGIMKRLIIEDLDAYKKGDAPYNEPTDADLAELGLVRVPKFKVGDVVRAWGGKATIIKIEHIESWYYHYVYAESGKESRNYEHGISPWVDPDPPARVWSIGQYAKHEKTGEVFKVCLNDGVLVLKAASGISFNLAQNSHHVTPCDEPPMPELEYLEWSHVTPEWITHRREDNLHMPIEAWIAAAQVLEKMGRKGNVTHALPSMLAIQAWRELTGKMKP